MKKKQSRTIHIGNQGEHIVSTLFSPKCIVRDVGQGEDTGIDLYCEIINDEDLTLSLHFFCQVKTRKRGSFYISEVSDDYFDYWANQPVPVFLIIVEYDDESTIATGSSIAVYDVPFILSKRDARTNGKQSPVRDVDEKFVISDVSNNKDKMTIDDFLYCHVSWSYGLWNMRRFGLVLPNPEVKEDKPSVLVGGFSYLYTDKIELSQAMAKKIIELEKQNR